MKLLALDQATRTTGFAIFKDGIPIKIGHFTIIKDDFAERLVEIRNTVIKLIEEYDIDTVAFEDIQLQNNVVQNVKTYKMLAEVFGVILELLQERKMTYHIVAPNVWKATFKIAGHGREVEKKLAQKYVFDNYGIKCTQDEADAVCIGIHTTKNTVEDFDWA